MISPLIAQAGQIVETWPAIVGSIASSGFAIWYAWHAATKEIPRINSEHASFVNRVNDRHAETVRTMNDAHAGTIRDITSEFRREQRETRSSFETSINQIQTEVSRTTRAVDQLCDKLSSPGPLRMKADSVVIKHSKPGSDTTGEMDVVQD